MDMENQLRPEAEAASPPAIGPEQLQKFIQILQTYRTGKKQTDSRIIATENWWKLRNTMEEQKETEVGKDGGFTSKSGWLHNVIVSKHADAMESYPEPNILPREEGDRQEAKMLSSIIPCILEQNEFEHTYSDVQWQKMKTGTGAYKVIWDKNMLNGLGDIRIERVNLLNLFWQPGITDIQKSRYFFQTELVEKEVLRQKYPQLKDHLKGNPIYSSKFLYDDSVSDADKATIIEVYYHAYQDGKRVLHYCKFVEDQVLFASENETTGYVDKSGQQQPPMAVTGLYDHGRYPYVLDVLFPIEGSPCGYGYVDLCKSPQTEIDLMKTAFVKNTMVGAIPRYFKSGNANINEADFLDLSKPIIPVSGNVDDTSIRRVEHSSLEGNYLNLMELAVQELRETSGNTETATGTTNSGVTAASAIVALQEASGKGSRDSTQNSYRAYGQIVDFCIEIMRQFYTLPRQFRILGQYGAEEYVTYTNQMLRPQHQGEYFGQDMGYRKPVFDVKVSAQKKNVYTKVSQNELALQFFKMGFFNPQLADQAIMCLGMMEFDGKDGIMQKVSQNGMLIQKLSYYMQMALSFAQAMNPMQAQQIAQDIVATFGETALMAGASASGKMYQSDHISDPGNESGQMRNARQRSSNAAQPKTGRVTAQEGK